MNILIYDENFHTIHENVKYLLPVIELLSKTNEVTLLGDRYFEPEIFKTHYNIPLDNVNCQYLEFRESANTLLAHWQHISKCKKISELTSNYDVFFNNKFNNHWQIDPKARYNIGLAYFPLNPLHRWQQKESLHLIKNIARKVLLSSPEKYIFTDKYQEMITISDFAKQFIQNYWTLQNIQVLYPWIDVLEKKNEPVKEDNICSVLRLHSDYSQNIPKMIEYFKMVHRGAGKDWSFHIALAIDVNAKTKMLKNIAGLKKLIGNLPVYIHINLSKTDLNDLYNRSKIYWSMTGYGSDVQMNPENFESFDINAAEAMSYQCVPVVINEGGNKEIIEQNISGHLVNNFQELGQATARLITNPAILQAMAKSAYTKTLMFSKERFIYEFSKNLKKLI